MNTLPSAHAAAVQSCAGLAMPRSAPLTTRSDGSSFPIRSPAVTATAAAMALGRDPFYARPLSSAPVYAKESAGVASPPFAEVQVDSLPSSPSPLARLSVRERRSRRAVRSVGVTLTRAVRVTEIRGRCAW